MSELLELVTPASVASSLLLGGLVGALYGFELAPTIRPRFPVSLFSVGLAFIAMIAVFTSLTPQAEPRSPAFAIGRALLWTLTCTAIPGGRWARGKYAEWRKR